MIVDGKAIQEEMKHELKREVSFLALRPRLVVVQVGTDAASTKFVSMKRAFAEEIGVEFILHEFPESAKTEQLVKEIQGYNKDARVNGIIVQLPLPKTIDSDAVIEAIHPAKDPDALRMEEGESFRVPPPVAGAVEEILTRHEIVPQEKHAVVVGYGRLVGKPVAQWLVDNGAHLRVVDKNTPPELFAESILAADIIVSGAGVPGLLKPEMVKEGVVLIDAGTSEGPETPFGNKPLVGDIDPLCAEKASLFAPVPGGVGPITVATIFKNLLALIPRQALDA